MLRVISATVWIDYNASSTILSTNRRASSIVNLRELLRRFEYIVFLPSRVSFSTPFLINCGSGGWLEITCLKTVVGASKGMLPVKYFCSTKPLFVSVEFHGDNKTVTKLR